MDEKKEYKVEIGGRVKRKIFLKITREYIWNKYNKKCAYCGCSLEYKDMQIDHIIPYYNYSEKHGCIITEGRKITEYGIHDIENLNPACRVCNKWKATWTLEEFRRELQSQIKKLELRSSGFRVALKYKLIELTGKKVQFYFEENTLR